MLKGISNQNGISSEKSSKFGAGCGCCWYWLAGGKFWLGDWSEGEGTWNTENYSIASAGHYSSVTAKAIEQTYRVEVIRSLVMPSFSQTRERLPEAFDMTLAIQAGYAQQNHLTASFSLSGRVWLGDWSDEQWKTANYSISSSRHYSTLI